MKNNQYIVIVGCGRLGSYLANSLSRDGNSVVIIDQDEKTFERLSPDFSGFRLEGDATHMAVLKQAKLKEAQVLIATTEIDNINLMVAQIAKKIFEIPRVLARIMDPQKQAISSRLGIETICPTSLAADMFLHSVTEDKISNGEEK